MRRVIAPALARGEIVVCERFADSMVAYQGYGGELPLDALHALNALATGGLEPDVTFLLDVDPVLAFERRAGPRIGSKRGKDQAFYHRVRQGYLVLQRNILNGSSFSTARSAHRGRSSRSSFRAGKA